MSPFISTEGLGPLTQSTMSHCNVEYDSLEWTNQAVALDRAFCIFCLFLRSLQFLLVVRL